MAAARVLFSVAGGDGDQRLAGSGVVQHPADDFSLPGAQFHAAPRPGALGHGHVPLNEGDSPGTSTARQAPEVERRGGDLTIGPALIGIS
jgi:hypothetical protein